MTVNLRAEMATKCLMGGIRWTKRWFTPRMRRSGTAWDCITLLRIAFNLKLKNYFWNFPFVIFGLWLTTGNWNCKRRNQGYRWGSTLCRVWKFYPKNWHLTGYKRCEWIVRDVEKEKEYSVHGNSKYFEQKILYIGNVDYTEYRKK